MTTLQIVDANKKKFVEIKDSIIPLNKKREGNDFQMSRPSNIVYIPKLNVTPTTQTTNPFAYLALDNKLDELISNDDGINYLGMWIDIHNHLFGVGIKYKRFNSYKSIYEIVHTYENNYKIQNEDQKTIGNLLIDNNFPNIFVSLNDKLSDFKMSTNINGNIYNNFILYSSNGPLTNTYSINSNYPVIIHHDAYDFDIQNDTIIYKDNILLV